MEKVIYISQTSGLEDCKPNKYDRVYFGVEFCEKLIPSRREIDRVVKFCEKNNLGFTFITPYLSDRHFQRCFSAVRALPDDAEIVVNDWGLFNALQDHRREKAIIGRILVKQAKDPRIEVLARELTPDQIRFSRICSLSSTAFQEFLISNGVNRAEIDNSFQGHEFKLLPGIKASIYHPYVYMTTTNKCVFKRHVYARSCKKECVENEIELRNKKNKIRFVMRGNTVFINTRKSPPSIAGVDRIVYMPKIPF